MGAMSGQPHPGEQHSLRLARRLNQLRAAVLGANDGIVSEAGLVIGVAGAVFFAVAFVLRIEELDDVAAMARRKLGRFVKKQPSS